MLPQQWSLAHSEKICSDHFLRKPSAHLAKLAKMTKGDSRIEKRNNQGC